ncbi:MAG: hypothetical protein JO061_11880 [Acidobacteriaceae bacterium]|nr:hypothetical protein [Acidobacteriaceae bacterium]
MSFTCFAAVAALAPLAFGGRISTPPNDWKISGPFGGTATTVAVDPRNPNKILAGALNTLLYQSQDFGGTWTLISFPTRNLGEVTSILVDPNDTEHYLVGVQDAFAGGLFESHDQGKTWTAVSDIRDFGVHSIAAAPSDPTEFVAGTMHGVMLSTDSGKTWSRISDPGNLEMQGITAVAIDPKDSNTIYAGTSHLPWKTTDRGKTWQSIHDGMIDDSDVFSIFVDPTLPNDIYASACSGIYASQNRGDLWKKIAGIPNTSRRTHVIRIDPTQPGTIYAGTTTGLFKSTNNGTNWRTLTDMQVNSIAFDPSDPKKMYFAMEYEGLAMSDDGGQTLKPINEGFADRQINAVTVLGNKLAAIETQEGESTGFFLSADRGESWSHIHAPRGLGGVHLRAIAGSHSEDRILLGVSTRDLYKSIDSGALWKPLPLRVVTQPVEPPPPTKSAARSKQGRRAPVKRYVKPRPIIRTLTPSEIEGLWTIVSGSKEVFYLGTNLGLFTTSDFGEQWTLVEMPGAVSVTAMYASPDGATLIARSSGGLYASKDAGQHWQQMSFPLPAMDVNDIAVPADPNGRILVATRVGLYSSTDGGQTWYANASGIQASTVSAVAYAGPEHSAYAVEYGQLYRSSDGGISWTSEPTAIRGLQIRQLWAPDSQSTRLYAVTSGLGVLFRD